MVVAAKAELLRRGEDILSSVDANSRSAAGYFPGGWGSSTTPGSPDSAVRTPTASAQNNRNRAASYDVSNTVTNPRAKGVLTKINTNLPNLARGGYVPPTPSYAISSSDPIPSGYVTHARDACTQIDYRWDSMRHPQNWGNGGEYGEEWSAMHTRFRQFLGNMVGWYRGHDRPSQSACNGESLRVGEDDDEEETVLVVITHGAGCNALIGALTGEPVFVDVGTASLTYAVSNTVESPPSDSLLRQYSLKLVASVDHLRPASNQSDQSALASPRTLISPPIPSYRHRVTSRSSLSQNSFVGRSATTGASAREWAMPRPSTTPRGSPGLWGQDGGTDSADEMVPNFEGPGLPAPLANGSADSPGESPAAEEPTQRTFSQPGLWGSAPSNQEREAGLNRRWTVTERRM